MTDTTGSTPPAPLAASPDIAIDAANVVHGAERDTRHGLSHLEDEFVAEFKKTEGEVETKAKAALAWLASKL